MAGAGPIVLGHLRALKNNPLHLHVGDIDEASEHTSVVHCRATIPNFAKTVVVRVEVKALDATTYTNTVAFLPGKVALAHRDRVARLIMEANLERMLSQTSPAVGQFDMDYKDGEVRFRTCFGVDNARKSAALKHLIENSILGLVDIGEAFTSFYKYVDS